MSQPFTKRSLEAIKPTGKQFNVRDEKTPGLILMVTPKGAKTFYSYRWLDGRPERIKIGTFPAVTVEQARAAATKINGAVASGGNPAEVKRTVRAEPTFGEIFERFLQEKRNRSGKPLAITTATGYRKVVDTYLNGIKAAKLSGITPERARSLVSKIKSPAQLNHAKAILSSVFNWANDEGIIDQPNPARRLKTKAIPSRERFLLPSELPRFMAAVEASPLRDFFLLALFTGARRSNLQAMRWRDVNLEEATWTIPKTKNGAPQTVTLPPEAVEIIRERRRQAIVNACYVFPGPGATGHLVEPKAAWRAILEAAELDNLRLHDLRRTLGSWQAKGRRFNYRHRQEPGTPEPASHGDLFPAGLGPGKGQRGRRGIGDGRGRQAVRCEGCPDQACVARGEHTMKATYLLDDDILYLRFNDKPIAREVAHGWNINVGYATDGDMVEMTVLDARAAGLYPIATDTRQAA